MKKFTLSRKERLRGKKEFDLLFAKGKILYSSDKKFKSIYILAEETELPAIKIVAAVSKKSGNAVWRNRVKRLIKESYRLNKEQLITSVINKNLFLRVIFSPNNFNSSIVKNPGLSDVSPGIIDLLVKLNATIK